MDILAASYTNIGPFFDKTISLVFRGGTYVINAPVGVGKSFLFFDGPVFSLYKHAPRPLRNRRSPTGHTELLFVVDDDIWLVCRYIGMTKAGGDSVKTKLYSYQKTRADMDIVLGGYDIFSDISWKDLLNDDIQEIVCANEAEVESLLRDLLPPKEVVLSANFLMQDAVNVFELRPSDRLDIFKHIFGFIGIDHAKETLRTKRKEVQTRITVMRDISDLEHKFHDIIQLLKKDLTFVSTYVTEDRTLARMMHTILKQKTLQDLMLLDTQISISGFSCDIHHTSIDDALVYIDHALSQRNTALGKYEQFQETLDNLKEETKLLKQEYEYVSGEISKLEKHLKGTDIHRIASLEKELQDLINTQQVYDYTKYIDILTTYGYEVDSFVGCVRIIDELIAAGKEIKSRMQNYDETHQKLQQQENEVGQRIITLQRNIEDLQQQHKQHMTFSCDKIQGLCPYVQAIRGVSEKVLSQQEDRMQKELAILQQHTYAKQKQEVGEQYKATEEKSKIYIDILQTVGWKTCLDDFTQRERGQKRINEQQALLRTATQSLGQQQEEEKQLDRLRVKQQVLHDQSIKKHEEYLLACDKHANTKREINLFDETYIKQLKDVLYRMKQQTSMLQEYVEKYTQEQLAIQHLEEEQIRLKHLYTLFSKELLLLVLQDFLPNIESIMNMYLDDVADYTVSFLLEEDAGDKISLDIFAQDQRGVRPVKSLSGGQKSLLKLAWTLSIASLMQLPFLFLDETITSLDAATTADVADVLHRFVQTYDIKFYVVTHAPQIQEMSIRDKELVIPV